MRSLLRKGLPVADRALRAVGLARVGPNSGDPFRDVDPISKSIYEAVKRFTNTWCGAITTRLASAGSRPSAYVRQRRKKPKQNTSAAVRRLRTA